MQMRFGQLAEIARADSGHASYSAVSNRASSDEFEPGRFPAATRRAAPVWGANRAPSSRPPRRRTAPCPRMDRPSGVGGSLRARPLRGAAVPPIGRQPEYRAVMADDEA